MLDAEVVAVSRQRMASAERGGAFAALECPASKKGTGFVHPWARMNTGMWMFLPQPWGDVLLPVQCPGWLQRYVVHWDIREAMTEAEVELILQRQGEVPGAKPGSSRQRSSLLPGISRNLSGSVV